MVNKKKVRPFFLSCQLDSDYRVIDEDTWPEILKRLPIKSLCRFQSVCKGWNSFISSAFFIDLHHSFTSSATPCYLKPYLRHLTTDLSIDDGRERYELSRPLHDDVTHRTQQLRCPFQAEERSSIVDVIHGVVCIDHDSYASYFRDRKWSTSVLLWNPSIHKYVALPRLTMDHLQFATGFGYDTRNNDFKVVLISLVRLGAPLNYQVCSTRQGFSWRPPVTTSVSAVVLDHNWCLRGTGCFVNGTIHWLADGTVGNGIDSVIMFDCESEELRSIDIPEKHFWLSENKRWREVELLEYGGMLAALVLMFPVRIELWVMEEHGVSNSWKKRYVFSQDDYGFEWRVTICDPSTDHQNLAPYNTSNNPLIYFHERKGFDFVQLKSDHVYEESMFLMDHPKAVSYPKEGIVKIQTLDVK